MKRISIIGLPGAGKTTLSRALAATLPVRLVNQDSYLWGPNWTWLGEAAEDEFRAALREDGAWIADGLVIFGPEEMLTRADLVIYLDYSAPRLLLHILRRWLIYRKNRRPELAPGCEDRLPLSILLWLAAGRLRGRHEKSLAFYPPRRLARIRSPGELRAFVERDFTAMTAN